MCTLKSWEFIFFDRRSVPTGFSEERNGTVVKDQIYLRDEEYCQILHFEDLMCKVFGEIQKKKRVIHRHSISGVKDCVADLKLNHRKQSDIFICDKEIKNLSGRGRHLLKLRHQNNCPKI